MKFLQLKTQIFKCNNSSEFVSEFNISKNDLIFTNKRLFNVHFKNLNLDCSYLFKDDYNFNEPNDEIIDKIIKDISDIDFERIIAIGGGSIIDVGKLLALKDIENIQKLFKRELPIVKDKKLIIIPTTCGTGSEVTNISIIELKEGKTKIGLASDELYADQAVLIPEFCNSIPYKFFVYSSIDALIHALESFISPNSNPYTELFSIEAIKIIIKGYKDIIINGEEYRNKIIDKFLIASNYAGIAFGNAGVGAIHALSYPLGGKYHVPHGEANYEFLISVFDFYNKNNPKGKINKLNTLLSEILKVPKHCVYLELDNILNKLIKRKSLREYGMTKEEIVTFSNSVIETQQRLLSNNYVYMSKEDIIEIYNKLY